MLKKWWMSKTLWVNIIALIAIILQEATGHEAFNPEYQAMILGVINMILRTITKEKIIW